MHFQIGEKVVFLKEPGGGIVRKIVGQVIYVEDETGFDRPFRIADIAKVHGTEYTLPDENDIFLFSGETNNVKKSIQKDCWEIDLHFEEIEDQFGKILQQQALEKQLSVFKSFYNKARSKKIRKLIVIHGFGKGILREEIHLFLKGQDGVDFFDAPYVEYGHGATQVEIKYRY